VHFKFSLPSAKLKVSGKCSITTAEFTVAQKLNQGTFRRRGVIGGGVLFWLLFLTRKKVTHKATEKYGFHWKAKI
jgi:hypothetical protein